MKSTATFVSASITGITEPWRHEDVRHPCNPRSYNGGMTGVCSADPKAPSGPEGPQYGAPYHLSRTRSLSRRRFRMVLAQHAATSQVNLSPTNHNPAWPQPQHAPFPIKFSVMRTPSRPRQAWANTRRGKGGSSSIDHSQRLESQPGPISAAKSVRAPARSRCATG